MSIDIWRQMPLNVLDFESTGIDPTTDRAVQAAFVEFRPAQRPVTRTWLVDPGVEIPKGASDVHGWTTERLRLELGTQEAAAQVNGGDKRPLSIDAVFFELTGLIALGIGRRIPLVAFNAAYDVTLLEAENRRHGVDTLASRLPRGQISPVVDPFVLDKQISRRRGKRTLTHQCQHYTVPLLGAHDAAGDALATGRLVVKVMEAAAKSKQHNRIVTYTLPMLHQAQIGWRAEQCDSLRKYFDREGIEHDGVDPGWPVYEKALEAQAGAA